MIARRAHKTVVEALERQAAVAIIGPRQVGTTTLAHEVAEGRNSLYPDLESPRDRAKLPDPELFLSSFEDRLVILDEIHPKIFVRDSGLVHALLGIEDANALAGHPIVGMSWEGFVVENLIAAAPLRTTASFYRTSAGAEIDLVLKLPGTHGVWAIEIKRG